MFNVLALTLARRVVDKFGRRNQMLTSLALLSLCLLFTGFWQKFLPFTADQDFNAILLCLLFIGFSYSFGSGPIPMIYALEAYPFAFRFQGTFLGEHV